MSFCFVLSVRTGLKLLNYLDLIFLNITHQLPYIKEIQTTTYLS